MTPQQSSKHLILASSSTIRRHLLHNAGVSFDVRPAMLNEKKIRDEILRTNPKIVHSDISLLIAEKKAQDISLQFPNALVLGCDQILTTGSYLFSKPENVLDARQTLEKLRGKTHWLHSGLVLTHNGQKLWCMVDTAELTMYPFSDAFLERYLKDVGETILGCVGAYQLEGPGIRLFQKIQGDYYTILGLPLLPLLHELRKLQVIEV